MFDIELVLECLSVECLAQDAVRREDEMAYKRVSKINEEGEEEYWDQQADAVDNNVSIISQQVIRVSFM